jgi:hypothetical protein
VTYRVVQWTTGKIGAEAIRGIVAHPELELVGAYAFSLDKVGRDVGDLCGLDPIGVVASGDVDALLALEPDCVSYMPYRPDFDHVVRILESGANVVTTLYMLAGWGNGDAVHDRIVAAAERGGASLLAGGIYPGHANNVAMALSAMCARVDGISLLESLELSTYHNEKMFRVMGFDGEVGDPAIVELCEATNGSFKDCVRTMAHEMGVELDEVHFDVEFAAADRTLDFGFMTIGEGRIAGIKGVVSGIVGGVPRFRCGFAWALGEEMSPRWPITHGYSIEIAGDPDVHCTFSRVDTERGGELTVAMPVVNAIPDVCAAPPGIVNFQALPYAKASMR